MGEDTDLKPWDDPRTGIVRLQDENQRLRDETADNYKKWFEIMGGVGITEYQPECAIVIDQAIRRSVERRAKLTRLRELIHGGMVEGHTMATEDEPEKNALVLSKPEFDEMIDLISPAKHKPCIWREDEEGIWHTECGNSYFFDSGTPADNKQAFCGYCGRPLTEEPVPEETADDDED